MTTIETKQLDTTELEDRVRSMYEEVARQPEREFHFETGARSPNASDTPKAVLDRIPAGAVDSHAGAIPAAFSPSRRRPSTWWWKRSIDCP